MSPVSFFEEGWFPMCTKTKDNNIVLDDEGCYSFTSIFSNNEERQQLTIYPNEVGDNLTINSPINQTIVVYDLLGKQVHTASIAKGKNTVDLSFLTPQLYVLKASDGKTMVSQKFMKL